MNKARLVATSAALVLAPALGGCGPRAAETHPPLEGARLGGAFTLTDQDSRMRTETMYLGRYRLMYFGYTFCPDVCPTTLQSLMKGYHLLARRDPAAAAKLVPIFVTVDPERDTPAAVRAYVAAFGPGLIGLTGSAEEIAAVAKRYGVSYQKRATPGAGGYLMDHMSQPMLFGPKGEPIALIAADAPPDRIADELARWVR